MPRKKRIPSPTGVYHWINRGINRKHLFHFKDDHEYFLKLLKEHKTQFDIDIYHYCLMPNHIHLLLRADDIASLSRFSQYLQRRYAYYYCKNHKWKGQVFQRMYKSIAVDKDTYLLECGRYIERNPVRANLVKEPGQYTYSSYLFYAGQKENDILTPSPAYLGLAQNDYQRAELYRDYVSTSRPYEDILDVAILKS